MTPACLTRLAPSKSCISWSVAMRVVKDRILLILVDVDLWRGAELDADWLQRVLRRRATTLIATLWILASMAMVCCIQLLQVSSYS